MTVSVLAIVAGLVLVILGYRLDTDNGRIEQGALLQFASTPSGATVKIDDKEISSKTSTKSSVLAGIHTFAMERDGYETWQKTLDIKAGTLTWLDYVRFVPKNRTVQSVASYASLYASIASTDGKTMLVQQSKSAPTFEVVDLRSDDIKSETVTLPPELYSEATTDGIKHAFQLQQWDTGGRYVLLRHIYGDKKEWLVMDTQDISASKNVTTLLDIDISQITFAGTSGNILYALTEGDIRKLDLSAGTISRSLIMNVTQFEIYQTNVITYVGTDPTDTSKTVVGLYREGDNAARILRSVTTASETPLHIVTSRYFNQDYVAISEGANVDIFMGSYPAPASEDSSSLAKFASFTFSAIVGTMTFSPNGDYLLVQSGSHFTSYDIEHMRIIDYTIKTDKGVTVSPVKWLDDDHTWSDYSDSLIMREFDGENSATINQVVPGQGVTITQNDRYMYSFGKNADGFQLQRVRMVLQ